VEKRRRGIEIASVHFESSVVTRGGLTCCLFGLLVGIVVEKRRRGIEIASVHFESSVVTRGGLTC